MTSSPLDLGPGWWARPRGLTAWPLYQSLSVIGRRLVDVLLERARWKAGDLWILGHRIELQPGQLITSEEELARLCGRGTTRKAVRGAIGRLMEGQFLDRRPVLPAGQCPYLITINDYALLQVNADNEGPRKGPPEGQARANEGPAKGPLKNKVNPGNTETLETLSPDSPAARRAPRGKKQASKTTDPRHAPAADMLFRVFGELSPGDRLDFTARDGKALREFLARQPEVTPAEIEARWRRALALGSKFPGCRSVHQLLNGRWNDLALNGAIGSQRPTPATKAGDFANEVPGGF